ncbi:MAG: sulfurtransferase TusA family protein [Lachnospiraceae bacterium]|jgi:TusA-related sulfurtransferase|nr:sulfurtransferase TusA family protein [Lachnospiraceae bacterium]
MIEIDARGLSCPEPLMLVADALKAGNDTIKVLVDEEVPKLNIEKFIKGKGKKANVKTVGEHYEMIIE